MKEEFIFLESTVEIINESGEWQSVQIVGNESGGYTLRAPNGMHFKKTENGFRLVVNSEEADTPAVIPAN